MISDKIKIFDGPMSNVFKGIWDDTRVAIKVPRNFNDEKAQKLLNTELDLLVKYQNPRIVEFIGICTDGNRKMKMNSIA
jgi:hypothetical protein